MKKAIVSPNESKISHYLGIDYGLAKIGLALADLETKMAFAYTAIKNDKNLLSNLSKIIKEKNVSKVIIGVPTYISKKKVEYGGETLGKLIAKSFFGMRIEYQDEMFTTIMAENNLIARGAKKIKRYDDKEAARIILQSYLDRSRLVI
jgi:putative Holliday junction resolvase